MELLETTLPIFYASRIFGLAPYLINRNSKGKISDIRRSLLLCIYSAFVLVTTVSLTFRFLVNDANSRAPIRMKTATSKFVTTFDVFVVVAACACGAITGIVGLQNIKALNAKLKEVDHILSLYTDSAQDKRKSYYLLVTVFAAMTGMIAMDLSSRIRMAKKVEATFASKEEAEDVFLRGYFPFYVLYYILMALQTQFYQTAYSMGRRYHRLNLAIQNAFILPTGVASSDQKVPNSNSTDQINHGNATSVNQRVDETRIMKTTIMHNSHSRFDIDDSHDGQTIETEITTSKKPTSHVLTLTNSKTISVSHSGCRHQNIDLIAYTHALLREAVATVSGVFGFTLLALLVSCLLHLVATSYFLFIEILGDNDIFVSSLQLIWCGFHSSRLLLVVEPCHKTSYEASRTITIVCDILRNCKEPVLERGLKKFWKQLLADRCYCFSACGMCDIDRRILTAFSGAIATYLVILIQFQKTDG